MGYIVPNIDNFAKDDFFYILMTVSNSSTLKIGTMAEVSTAIAASVTLIAQVLLVIMVSISYIYILVCLVL